ncbi:MAG: molecular chaperone HtpG [Myxococcales bacterium]|nr:molecular chaperone HtpG [Myxococcales bacterium]
MDSETLSTEPTPRETHRFQAEVSQVLHLVIHSLYSNREVFLRELVSNASDAIDKLRFRALTEASLQTVTETPAVRLVPNEDARTLSIEDDGIGMTHDELVENLGTIAHSGSKKFVEMLKQRGEAKDLSLIGQFGVGFYSAWLVADRVEVVSRAAGHDDAWRFVSDARESFTLEPAERAHHGTTVILHLRDDQSEYTDRYRLRELVRKYSDFVSHPIKLAKAADEAQEGDAFEVVNEASALWQRARGEVTAEQHDEFYKHLTGEFEGPLAHTHFKVEGSQEFAGVIYLPRTAPHDFDTPGEKRRGVRLYVKRVFIMDDCDALVPTWLRFVRGVLDSDDLPLNVSRETLQDSATVRAIKKGVTKKVLDLLDDLAKTRADDYTTFFATFGRVLKEGLHADWEHRDRLARLMRYESTRGDGLVSLADYVAKMPEGQKAIYYAIGESRAAVADSPHLEACKKHGYEVLFMTDLIDTWAVESLREFEGKKFVSVQNAELSLDESPEAKATKEAQKTAFVGLFDRVKAVLGARVKDVRTTDRLTDSPACLVLAPGSITPQVERVMRAHGKEVPPVQRILEVNPTHPLIEALQARADAGDPAVSEYVEVLYDQALLTEGTPPDDPQKFARRITALLQAAVTK